MKIEQYLDMTDFSERVDGDTELIVELYKLFLEDSKKLIADIANSVERNDAGALRISAHTLKGSSASISAWAMQDVSSEMENIAIANDLPNARPVEQKLLHCYEMTVAEIQSTLKKLSRAPAVSGNETKA
jgi:HPt (histidine-containing phosphotransfer) domain-containing protein